MLTNVREFAGTIRRHWLLVIGLLAIGAVLVVVIVRRTPPTYVASATVLMVAEPPEQQNTAIPSSPTKPIVSSDLPTIVQSAVVLRRVAAVLKLEAGTQSIAKLVKARLQGTNVMLVQFTSNSPAGAIRGANAVGDELARYYRQIATSRFDSLAADLRTLLDQTSTRLQRDDEQLAEAARQYPYVDTKSGGTDGQSIYGHLVALQTAQAQARAAAAGSTALASVASRLTSDVRPLALSQIGETHPQYRALRDQYARDLTEYEKARARYTEAYPGLAELRAIVHSERSAVASARADLSTESLGSSAAYSQALVEARKAQAASENDRARLSTLNHEIAAAETQLSGNSGLGARVARIRRDRDAATETYSVLASRLATTLADRAVAASTGTVLVVDRAIEARRSVWSSARLIAVALGFVVAWFALGAPFALEAIDRRFRENSSVESVYGMPVIASIR